jgi:NTE family protein
MFKRKRNEDVALGLSGGAAQGLGHIGALKAMEEYELRPEYIAGTSAGALIGGMYAAGISVPEMEDIVREIDRDEFRKLLDITWARGSIVAGDRIEKFIRRIVGDVLIEDLDTPFIAAAVDLKTGKGFHFDSGLLVDAIRASISIPGIFKPVVANNAYLVDGGVRRNLPLQVLRRFKPDKLIGVNIVPGPRIDFSWSEESIQRTESGEWGEPDFIERVKEFFTGHTGDTEETPGMTYLFSRIFEIYTAQVAQAEIEQARPDLVITLDMSEIKLWEFWRGEEAAKIGYNQAKQVLESSSL